MDELQIKQATIDDAEELVQVYHSAYQENRQLGFPAKAESVTESGVSEWIQEKSVYIAKIKDEVIGGVRLEATDSDRVKLSRLAVHEGWKGKGIGSSIMDYAEKVVRDCGYDTIWLTTPENHPYLPDFYRSRSYEKSERYPLEYRAYDEIVLEKEI